MTIKQQWDRLPHIGPYPDLARRAMVCDLYFNGMTIRQIATAVNVSYQAIHKLLKDAGVPLRPRGGNTGPHSRRKR